MKTVLHYYDIFPKVLLAGQRVEITVVSLGRQSDFEAGMSYSVSFVPVFARRGVALQNYETVTAIASVKELKFSYMFEDEGPYNLVIRDAIDAVRAEMTVYCLYHDLHALVPLVGDLHVHSNYSSGKEAPEIVAAYYRKAGFDFMAITDHNHYEPSLEAQRAYIRAEIDLGIFPGEEIHPPQNEIHTVHFGGSFSVCQYLREHPEVYAREVAELQHTLDIPAEVNAYEYASVCWVYNKIREGGGLAIFPHPCWITKHAQNVAQAQVWNLFLHKEFDAFELIGGQTLGVNNMQVSLYQEAREKGAIVPVIGNSDSHGVINSEWFRVGKTIVLARENTATAIIEAVKDYRSVALEQYEHAGEAQPRVYGPHRITAFAMFLLEEYLPLHDDLCYEEGRLMKEYVNGVTGAAEMLAQLKGRTTRLHHKYWYGTPSSP